VSHQRKKSWKNNIKLTGVKSIKKISAGQHYSEVSFFKGEFYRAQDPPFYLQVADIL
jgi:hypothetical protein